MAALFSSASIRYSTVQYNVVCSDKSIRPHIAIKVHDHMSQRRYKKIHGYIVVSRNDGTVCCDKGTFPHVATYSTVYCGWGMYCATCRNWGTVAHAAIGVQLHGLSNTVQPMREHKGTKLYRKFEIRILGIYSTTLYRVMRCNANCAIVNNTINVIINSRMIGRFSAYFNALHGFVSVSVLCFYIKLSMSWINACVCRAVCVRVCDFPRKVC